MGIYFLAVSLLFLNIHTHVYIHKQRAPFPTGSALVTYMSLLGGRESQRPLKTLCERVIAAPVFLFTEYHSILQELPVLGDTEWHPLLLWSDYEFPVSLETYTHFSNLF